MIAALGGRGVSELESGTIVVLPSLTFPPEELRKILGIQFYEERLLCMLLLLDRTDLDIVYVTSTPIDPAVVDYYLSFLKDPESARERLHLVALEDPRPVALSAKVFDHRDGVDLIRRAVVRRPAYLFPFNVTGAEERISEAAGLPLYGPDPRLAALGTKSGAREVAIDAGVPVPVGAGDLYSVEELDRAVGDILRKSPSVRRVVVKLNNGFSGQGNAIVDVSGNDGTIIERPTDFCAEEESWPTFVAKVEREGAVVEELLDAPGTVSPSVQLRIFPDATHEVVSTHDQILGGPRDQVYLGCRFPADPAYRMQIQDYGIRIAAELAGRGVIGSFGVDLLVVPGGDMYLSEINLRLGGTTHPFLMARFATGGTYDHATGELVSGGRRLTYLATDNLKDDGYVGVAPGDVVAAVRRRGIAFDPGSNTGVMLHLLGPLSDFGKLGATCIAESAEDADRLYEELLDTLAKIAGD